MHNEKGVLRSKGLKWLKYLWKIERKERRERRRQLRELLKEQIKHEKLKTEINRLIAKPYDELDKFVELPENQEILKIIPNWEHIPIPKLWLILDLNKVLFYLNSQKLICPYCYHYGTMEDREQNEIVCEDCSSVIGDEIIQPEERLRLILEFLEKSRINYQ